VRKEDAMAVDFKVNGRAVSVDVPDGTRLLWVLRERLKLTGTKYGCGVAQCGACMVHVDGQPTFSCQTPTEAVRGRAITTIDVLALIDPPDRDGHGRDQLLHALRRHAQLQRRCAVR